MNHDTSGAVARAILRVIKIGGRAQGSAELAPTLLRAWQDAPGSLVLVHGGGDEVSALQRAMGSEPTFVGGRRVTSAADLEAVRMVLSGTINKRLVAQLAGAHAVGISGEDARLFEAQLGDPALGRVGQRLRVNPRVVHHLLAGGFLPVISPVGREADVTTGAGLNINGDDAAAALAVALGAQELLLVADVPGVLEDGALRPQLSPDDVHALVSRGVAVGGMAAKLDAALAALAGGVARVRIGALDALTSPTAGTTVSLAAAPAARFPA